MILRAVGLALLFAVLGCKKGPSWKSKTYTEISVKPQAGEVEIPESLWAKVLESQKSKEPPKGKTSEHAEKEVLPDTAMEPLKVYLIERNKGVLKGQNSALSFVAGGGQLDLSDYTANLKGSYYVAFEFMPESEKGETKVFFLSNSVLRKSGAEELGSGCNTYFDLTNRFASAMKNDGFLVNTSDQRDVSALAGTYVFAQSSGNKIHMATLIIKDDNHRALQCRH
jgi:hypothetical protein